MTFKAYLEAHPDRHHFNDDNPEDWVFEDWKDVVKLRNSSSRLENPESDATWVGVPQVSIPDPF